MTAKTQAERKAEERQRKEAEGLKRCEVWASPAIHPVIKEFAAKQQAKFKRSK